jgi:cytochrome c biogenesis protein CcmG/thiol:disulfide interchange protein DsbE
MRFLFYSLSMILMSSSARAEPAPDFQLRSINNESVKLSDYKGQVVLLDFWATWCGPCKVAMPHIQKLYDEHKERGFVVLSISIDEARTASKVKPYIKSRGYSFTVLLDKETEVVALYNPQKILPYALLIDRNGEIAWRHSGYVAGDEEELEKQVKALLDATP